MLSRLRLARLRELVVEALSALRIWILELHRITHKQGTPTVEQSPLCGWVTLSGRTAEFVSLLA